MEVKMCRAQINILFSQMFCLFNAALLREYMMLRKTNYEIKEIGKSNTMSESHE